MNRISVSALTLALTALAAGHALAADSGKTRAQVETERQQAVRSGAIAASIDGYGNQPLNEVFPAQYPATAKVAGKTRAQVEAERQEAVRNGNVPVAIDGFGGQKLNEAFPARYPAAPKAAGKTRAEVEAERQLAIRTGTLNQYPAY